MNASICSVVAALSLLIPAPANAQTPAPAAPLRHLVYSFTWGTSKDVEVNTSGISSYADEGGMAPGAASGTVDYTAGKSDTGTIAVDVIREQADSGLVVSISEQARQSRSAPPATCVVFSDTTIVCDPNKRVNDEELTLLRFLGIHFVDPNQLDANRHWRIQRTGDVSVTADYTIAKSNGDIFTIDEQREVKESGDRPHTLSIDATIGYDFSRTVPTSVQESTIERTDQGDQYTTDKNETVLQLLSDSLPTKAK